jgi:hypothetical protein
MIYLDAPIDRLGSPTITWQAWCGEEEANCVSGHPGHATGRLLRTNHVSEIRWAETADAGILPNARMPNTYTALLAIWTPRDCSWGPRNIHYRKSR